MAVNEDILEIKKFSERVYIKHPSEVPKGAILRQGKRGGVYYDEEVVKDKKTDKNEKTDKDEMHTKKEHDALKDFYKSKKLTQSQINTAIKRGIHLDILKNNQTLSDEQKKRIQDILRKDREKNKDTKKESMNYVKLDNKWIFSETANLKESLVEGSKKYILETKILPFGEISRNRIKYNEESVKNTHSQLIGKSLNHNHETEGANVYPRGEWIETYIQSDGMYGKAVVYDTEYNKDYIEWLKNAKAPQVSLQVNGSAENRHDDKGSYKEAFIEDWLEGSTVIVPGFDSAKGSFIVAMSEAFKGIEEEDLFFEKLNNIRETFENKNEVIVDAINKNKELPENKSVGDFDSLKNLLLWYERIPENKIKEIIEYITQNKNKELCHLKKEIMKKYGYDIEDEDLKEYTKVL